MRLSLIIKSSSSSNWFQMTGSIQPINTIPKTHPPTTTYNLIILTKH